MKKLLNEKYSKDLVGFEGKFACFEDERKRQAFWFYIEVLLVISILSLIGVNCFVLAKYSNLAFTCLFILGLIGYIVFCLIKIDKKRQKFYFKLKKELLFELCKNKNIKWHINETLIEQEELEKSGLFSSFNIKDDYDGFLFKFGGGMLKFCEIKLLENKHKEAAGMDFLMNNEKKFVGSVMMLEFDNLTFPKTIIEKKDCMFYVNIFIALVACFLLVAFIMYLCAITGGLVYSKDLIFNLFFVAPLIVFFIASMCLVNYSKRKIPQIKGLDLSYLKLNKRYNLYSCASVDDIALFVNKYFDMFEKISKLFKAKNMSCAFYENNIMLALPIRNLFRLPTIHKTFLRPDIEQDIQHDLELIYQMLDILKLK